MNIDITVRQKSTYTKHGCNFSGNLVVVEYWENLRENKTSYTVDDYYEAAMGWVKENYSNYRLLLGIPDIVIKLGD